MIGTRSLAFVAGAAALGTTGFAAASALTGAPADTGPTAAWVDDHRTLVGFVGIGRSPDGSVVAAAPVRIGSDASLVARAALGRRSGKLSWSTLRVKHSQNPTQIAATGESVFVAVSGALGGSSASRLFRASVPGEVKGKTVVLPDASPVATGLTRLGATHLGTIGTRVRGLDSDEQVLTVDTRGAHWSGPKATNTALFPNFSPASTAITESGVVVDPNARVQWKYPARPTASTYGVEGTGPGNNGVRGATGVGEDVVFRDTTVGPLKSPTTDKGGGAVTESFADERLAVFSPGGATRTLSVPVPAEVDQACRDRALVRDARDVVLSDPWNGPAGDVWVLAGCGRGRDDVDTGAASSPGSTDPDPIHTWLVRWTRGSYESSIVTLPLPKSGARSVDARGFTGADGVMYIVSGAGTIAVRGLPHAATPPSAIVRSVRQLKNGRVRVVISCVGTVGDLCSGQVTIDDRRGQLAKLPYAVEAGTAAMQPLVTREVAAKRTVRGKPRATLLP